VALFAGRIANNDGLLLKKPPQASNLLVYQTQASEMTLYIRIKHLTYEWRY
jgi:hypothetical protein